MKPATQLQIVINELTWNNSFNIPNPPDTIKTIFTVDQLMKDEYILKINGVEKTYSLKQILKIIENNLKTY